MTSIKDTLDEFFEDSLSDKQKEEKAYDEAKAKALSEIRESNENAKTMRMLQEALDKEGLDIEVTGRVTWKPGDPVDSNAALMAKHEWEDNASEEELQAVNKYLFKDKNGITRDMRFCAPERFPDDDDKPSKDD